MLGQQRLLNIACATKARSRVITLARSTREEVLHFSILGGYETGFATFISKVDKGSKAEEVGLKRGDQVMFKYFFVYFIFIWFIRFKTTLPKWQEETDIQQG